MEFDTRLQLEFSTIVRRGTPHRPSTSLSSSSSRPALSTTSRELTGPFLLNLDVFADALLYGGARYFCTTLVNALLADANSGLGLRAADLASILLTNRLTYGPSDSFSPEAVLSVLYTQILPDVIPELKNSAEGVALAHFVASCLLHSAPKTPSPASAPADTRTGTVYQEALQLLTQVLSEVVERVTRRPGPLLVFVTSFFGHPAISRCALPPSSHLKFAALLRTLGREDLLLNLFDLRTAEDQLSCAKLFAFPLRVDKVNSQIAMAE